MIPNRTTSTEEKVGTVKTTLDVFTFNVTLTDICQKILDLMDMPSVKDSDSEILKMGTNYIHKSLKTGSRLRSS